VAGACDQNGSDIKEKTEWLGHAIRMDCTKVDKKMFENKPGDGREVRGPRLRWLEWMVKANNREEWASASKEAKALRGPQTQ
jgi:hypothetical protein